MSWRQNMVCVDMVGHPPLTFTVRSATGCVVYVDCLPTSPSRNDETRHIDDRLVHSKNLCDNNRTVVCT